MSKQKNRANKRNEQRTDDAEGLLHTLQLQRGVALARRASARDRFALALRRARRLGAAATAGYKSCNLHPQLSQCPLGGPRGDAALGALLGDLERIGARRDAVRGGELEGEGHRVAVLAEKRVQLDARAAMPRSGADAQSVRHIVARLVRLAHARAGRGGGGSGGGEGGGVGEGGERARRKRERAGAACASDAARAPTRR